MTVRCQRGKSTPKSCKKSIRFIFEFAYFLVLWILVLFNESNDVAYGTHTFLGNDYRILFDL